MTSIHPLRSEDADEWAPLWEGYLRFSGSEVSEEITQSTFRRLVGDGVMHGALARDDEGHAVGLVHWLAHPATWSLADYCYLEDLFVSADARGTGAGRALIAHVREWAERNGCAKVHWLTREDNTTARALYDRVAGNTGYTHYQIALDRPEQLVAD